MPRQLSIANDIAKMKYTKRCKRRWSDAGLKQLWANTSKSKYAITWRAHYVDPGGNETQEHMESDFTKEMRENLDMGKEADKLVLWRKLTCAL